MSDELRELQVGHRPPGPGRKKSTGQLTPLIEEARRNPGEWVSAVFPYTSKNLIYKVSNADYGDVYEGEFEVAREKLENKSYRLYLKKVER